MRLRVVFNLVTTVTLSLALPQLVAAEPPSHAPAHGYRGKQTPNPQQPAVRKGDVEVMFDSELGIHVAVGLPGVLFHDGHYYRQQDGRWQVSVSGDGAWGFAASSSVPEVVVKSKKRHPGPARAK